MILAVTTKYTNIANMKLFSILNRVFFSIICISNPLYAADPTLPEAIDSLQ